MDLGDGPAPRPHYPDLPPPSGGSVTQLSPAPPGRADPPEPQRPIVRWTAAAKATAAVLALTTIGGVGFGISQFTSANDKADEISRLESEIDDLDDELDAAGADIEAASASGAEIQARLDAVTAEAADASARRSVLASLFPMSASTIASTTPSGSWGVVNTSDASQCTGFSDAAASCVPENFPTDIVVGGSPDAGYTASSAWYAPFALTFDGTAWSGSGPISDNYSNTCGGVINTTTVTVRFAVTAVWGDETTALLSPAELSGTVSVASGETAACVAASRSATFVTAAG